MQHFKDYNILGIRPFASYSTKNSGQNDVFVHFAENLRNF